MSSYNFMNLLKDNGYVPALQETSLIDELENGFNSISAYFDQRATDYSFMGLLKEKSYGLEPIRVAANDNYQIVRLAS